MENIKHCRAVALLCRQQAVLHPEASWQWLAEAERYEHLAEAEIEAHFKDCNGGSNLTSAPPVLGPPGVDHRPRPVNARAGSHFRVPQAPEPPSLKSPAGRGCRWRPPR